MWKGLVIILSLALVGCAQPPPPQAIHATNYKSDFRTRLDIIVNYHLQQDSGIIVIDIGNSRGDNYRYWLVQTASVDGEYILRSRRFYIGTKKKLQEVFKIPLPAERVTETFYVEAYDENKELIMKSEPITPGGQDADAK